MFRPAEDEEQRIMQNMGTRGMVHEMSNALRMQEMMEARMNMLFAQLSPQEQQECTALPPDQQFVYLAEKEMQMMQAMEAGGGGAMPNAMGGGNDPSGSSSKIKKGTSPSSGNKTNTPKSNSSNPTTTPPADGTRSLNMGVPPPQQMPSNADMSSLYGSMGPGMNNNTNSLYGGSSAVGGFSNYGQVGGEAPNSFYGSNPTDPNNNSSNALKRNNSSGSQKSSGSKKSSSSSSGKKKDKSDKSRSSSSSSKKDKDKDKKRSSSKDKKKKSTTVSKNGYYN